MSARISRLRAPATAALRATLIVGAAVLLTACDASVLESAPATVCTEAGAQCQLPTGPLGVCERTQCPDGTNAPCFACISQH